MFLTGPNSPIKNAANPATAIRFAAPPANLEIPLVSLINLTISDDREDRHPAAARFRTLAYPQFVPPRDGSDVAPSLYLR